MLKTPLSTKIDIAIKISEEKLVPKIVSNDFL